MASRGVASYNEPDHNPPSKASLPTEFVQGFRRLLKDAMGAVDSASGKSLGDCIGVYAFYDYDAEPIYVGQTWLKFRDRIGRHLTGQRSDTLAYRILDPFEVAELEFWPTEHLRDDPDKQAKLNAIEYSVYRQAILDSKYKAILNEKIPPVSQLVEAPPSHRFNLVPEHLREDREHPDVRIARRAETLARVSAVAHERGEVSPGLRRVIVIQAVRLADLAAARLAFAEGRARPSPDAIDVHALVGTVLRESEADDGSNN
ncbi:MULTISPECIES: GIY-YIG nuclease family protein [Micromonospora]|uniref:GIY-YIG nuclease family protein n=1 Tax=Micromonospora solifontis TaxID=2487138 RepID=A0ABX9WMH6_9ACTN|nr:MULTISPECIES: GIY-YIG nuclease family protein [Micromonospora]NES13263.1 GIY-YIG nuclease family protein [Micromonospora sp. PPF5-17B]NES34632.1 GIY-YIG nuclease family protein [Micromonospora solifontis]NES57004.1 GIY-YIG nuclease family protein [Micromonospora sp. PPF5-6]RNM01875.1 GIY-YIG nuclease family protein [Micromonospora solifontis]